MYGKDFKKRVDIRQVRSFFLTGDELNNPGEGSPEQRYLRYTNGFEQALKTFRDAIINADWRGLDEKQRDIRSEEIWQSVFTQSANLNELCFEMGYCAGLKTGVESKNYDFDTPSSI